MKLLKLGLMQIRTNMLKLISVGFFLLLSFGACAQNEGDSITYKIENQTVLKSVFDALYITIILSEGGSCGKTTCGGVWIVSGKDGSDQMWVSTHTLCDAAETFELEKVKKPKN